MKRDAVAKLENLGVLNRAVMGSASPGPCILATPTGALFLNPATLMTEEYVTEKGQNAKGITGIEQYPPEIRLSANGKLLTTWRTHSSPTGITCHTLNGNRVTTSYAHDSSGALFPSPDGKTVFATRVIYNSQSKLITPSEDRRKPIVWYVPALTGDLYLAMNDPTRTDTGRMLEFEVWLSGQASKLLTLPPVAGTENFVDWHGGEPVVFDRHVYFNPDEKVLAIIPKSNDRIVLTTVDVSAKLDQSGAEYLLVTGKPPAHYTPGKPFAYDLAVKVKNAPAKFTLESGPKGMTITAGGKIEWTVPGDQDADVTVIVSVTDAGTQETFHTFTLKKAP
jgi:hypothetical protein